jgi:hypothetical protein
LSKFLAVKGNRFPAFSAKLRQLQYLRHRGRGLPRSYYPFSVPVVRILPVMPVCADG